MLWPNHAPFGPLTFRLGPRPPNTALLSSMLPLRIAWPPRNLVVISLSGPQSRPYNTATCIAEPACDVPGTRIFPPCFLGTPDVQEWNNETELCTSVLRCDGRAGCSVLWRGVLCYVQCCAACGVVLCCVVLCCLCCALPRCAVICCAPLCYAGLDWFSLCWAVLCCAVQLLWSALLCFILCDDMTAYRKIELQKTSGGQPKPGGANVLRSLALASFFC